MHAHAQVHSTIRMATPEMIVKQEPDYLREIFYCASTVVSIERPVRGRGDERWGRPTCGSHQQSVRAEAQKVRRQALLVGL
jgi:hypothetical protein